MLRLSFALALVALAAGCGGDDDIGGGDLVWEREPRVFVNPALPDDRILTGEIRNDSLERIELVARDLEVRSSEGARLESAAIFARSFGRGVFPRNRGEEIPPGEQLRIGLRLRLEPGGTAPVAVSWRQKGKQAALIEYGTGSLPVPEKVVTPSQG